MLVQYTYITLISYFIFLVLFELTQNVFTVGAACMFFFLYMSSYIKVGLGIANIATTEAKTVSTLKKIFTLYYIALAIMSIWMFFSTLNSYTSQSVPMLETIGAGLFIATLSSLIYKSSENLVGIELKKGVNNHSELFTCFTLLLLPISIFSISKRIERLA